MSRFIVTSELAETLRSFRQKNKIQAKDLAAQIGKSPAYVSKLENGNILTISPDELTCILNYIAGKDSPYELTDQIYQSLTIKYSAKEIKDQLWLINYDTVDCLVPIPDSLIEELNRKIDSLGISREYLFNRINANEAIPDDEKNDDLIPYNQWYRKIREGKNIDSIKIKYPWNKFNKLLDKQLDMAPYVFVYSVLFYLLKIQHYKEVINLSLEQNNEVSKETIDTLNSYRFLSISEKNRLMSEKHTEAERLEILNSFDQENISIITDIERGFAVASHQNVKFANEHLEAFRDNMKWDLGFMLKLVGMNYRSLNNASFSNKKQLISDIEDLIKKYTELPDNSKLIDTY